MSDPNPIPFESWEPDKSDRANPDTEAKGVYSVAGQYAPFPDIQQYGPNSTIDSFTKVLLHMDGADAATSFFDDAPVAVAHTWTANDNAQLDTADSKFGGTSGLFDGTNDYISTPDSADFELGSGDWTIECWFKCNVATGTNRGIAGQTDAGLTAAGSSWFIRRASSGQINCLVSNGSNFVQIFSESTYSNTVNTGWHHLALVRASGVLQLFMDSVQEGGNVAANFTVNPTAGVLVVGAAHTSTQYWLGWLDEFRISVGIARWSAGYVTGNDAFTKILLHFNAPDASTFFVDSKLGSTQQHAWTANDNAQTDTADFKFGGSSLLCDGTLDQISTPDGTDLTLGAGDWTIECWFKCTAASGATAALFGQSDAGATNAASSVYCQRNSSDVMRMFVSDGTNLYTITGGTQLTNVSNTGWHHLAIVRNGTVLRMFLDGLQEGGDVTIGAATVNDSSQVFVIGGRTSGATTTWSGWIDEFRLSVGIDRYSSLYLGNLPDSFTKVLVHGDGANTTTAIADQGASAAPHLFTVAGNAQIGTATSKFGGASMLFDGTGDWWRTPDAADLELGSGDWTIDFWFNCTAASGSFKTAIGKDTTAGTGVNADRSYAVFRASTQNTMRGNIYAGVSSFGIIGSMQFDNVNNAGWHHYALVRSGNNMWQFIDGTQDGQNLTLLSPTVNDLSGPLGIGSLGDESANPWLGSLDEVRLSVGVARWSALAVNGNDSFTKLLLHFNGPNTSTVLVSDEFGSGMQNSKVFTVAGTAKLDTSDSKFGGSSGLFAGGASWSCPDSNDFTLGSGDFTVECWFKCTATTGSTVRIAGQNDGAFTTNTRTFLLQRLAPNDQMQCAVCNASQTVSALSMSRYTDLINPGWHHIAFVRRGANDFILFIDGVLEGRANASTIGAINNSANNMGIGIGGEAVGNTWQGWLDEFRLSVGIARYVPASTTDNDQFTKVLLHMDGPNGSTLTFPDVNYGGASHHTWSAAGTGQCDTSQFKFGTASLKCGGAGDYINVADNADFTIGADDFTVDCWIRPQNTGVVKHIAGHMDAGATKPNMAWHIYVDINDQFVAEVAWNGNNSSILFGNAILAMDTWHHVALVKTGNSFLTFVNGVQDSSAAMPAGGTVNDSPGTIAVGRAGGFTSSTFIGWIDEFRLSIGIARWTTAFTPPTAAYGGAMFTPPTAAFGGPSFTPPAAAYAAGFSGSVPAAAFGSVAAAFTTPLVAYTYGGGAENIVQGADTFYDSSTAPHVFFGDAHRLYTLQSRSAVDISKAGGYTVGSSDTWQFMQFGDNVIAVTTSSAPQHYVMGTSVDYANLAGGPPSGATSCARVGDFAWLGKAYTVYWSAFNNVTDWAPSTVTQCGSQQLDQERGEIISLIGLDYAAIFQERGIRRAIYVGSPVVWDFGQDYIEKARGCIARNAAMAFGRVIFYAADDGFYAFDGQQSTPIGYGKVDQYFTRNLNYAWRHKVCVGADYQKKIIVWAWPSGSAQLPTDLLIFSMLDGRWTHDVIDLEFLFDTPAEPVTVDNFNLLFPANSLDGSISPNDIDSAAFDDRRIRLGAFDRSHLMQLFTGSARAATIDTKEFEPQPGKRGLITEVWPIGEYTDSTALSTAIGKRKALPGESVVFSNAKAMNRAGYCPHRTDGRFLRIRQSITAGANWRRAEAVHVTSTRTGGR